MFTAYINHEDVECCDNCEPPAEDCVCTCAECGDYLFDCCCDE